MNQLLVVEDDRDLNRGLCLALKEEQIHIVSCYDLKSAREKISQGLFKLVLLDVNLPDGSGLELLSEIKLGSNPVPVILLTANDTELDVVTGLEYGADDYITKPFSLAILRARVKIQMRRLSNDIGKKHIVSIDKYKFDFQRMSFSFEDEHIELSKTEQKLLNILLENRGTTVSRSVLLDRIWSDGSEFVDENTLSVTVKRLRDKLSASKYIKTVYGLGYTWVVK